MSDIEGRLLDACLIGDMRGLLAALAGGASADAQDGAGATALTLAAMGGSLRCVQMLLARGADPMKPCAVDGRTPLIYAAGNGFSDICAALLPLSDPRARDDFGSDALQASAWGGHLDCCAMLAPLCDPKAKDKQGMDAMDAALRSGSPECVDLLRPLSPPRREPPRRPASQITHLMLACALGDMDIIAEVLPSSDPWAKDPEGNDASEVARGRGHTQAALFVDAQKAAITALAKIQETLRSQGPKATAKRAAKRSPKP